MTRIPARRNANPRVLIVEDDDLQAQLLASVLRAAGFEVDIVPGGIATVWMVREGRYDVVVVDYQLPDIDGRAIANLVGDFMGDAARPVLIALTATPEALNARESGSDKAFDVVLGKSADFASLIAVINSRLALAAPDEAARQDAESLLLLKEWSDYDAEPPHPEDRHGDTGAARILVVEDDEFQRHLLASVLEQHGYIVETSNDGLDAVRQICGGNYDLVLVDYNLPEIDGLAIGRLIRDVIQEAVRPRLVAFTAIADRLKDREGRTVSVFDEIVQKSSDWPSLMASVDRHLKTSPNPDTRRAAAYDRSALRPAADVQNQRQPPIPS